MKSKLTINLIVSMAAITLLITYSNYNSEVSATTEKVNCKTTLASDLESNTNLGTELVFQNSLVNQILLLNLDAPTLHDTNLSSVYLIINKNNTKYSLNGIDNLESKLFGDNTLNSKNSISGEICINSYDNSSSNNFFFSLNNRMFFNARFPDGALNLKYFTAGSKIKSEINSRFFSRQIIGNNIGYSPLSLFCQNLCNTQVCESDNLLVEDKMNPVCSQFVQHLKG